MNEHCSELTDKGEAGFSSSGFTLPTTARSARRVSCGTAAVVAGRRACARVWMVNSVAMDTRFAIAVRDGDDLWLYLWLKRDSKGDVYVFWPRDEAGWNPHASYHASGRSHLKSHDKAFLPATRQNPDDTFSGAEQLVSTPIDLHSARATNKRCVSANYPGGVCEIPADEISDTNPSRTAVAIDLVSPGAPPLVYPETAVLRRCVFTDALPHISVALWDTSLMFAA